MHCPPILRLSGNFMVDVGRAGSVGPHLQSSFAFLELSDLPWDLKTPHLGSPLPITVFILALKRIIIGLPLNEQYAPGLLPIHEFLTDGTE